MLFCAFVYLCICICVYLYLCICIYVTIVFIVLCRSGYLCYRSAGQTNPQGTLEQQILCFAFSHCGSKKSYFQECQYIWLQTTPQGTLEQQLANIVLQNHILVQFIRYSNSKESLKQLKRSKYSASHFGLKSHIFYFHLQFQWESTHWIGNYR